MNQPTQPTPTPLVNVHALTYIETASHGYLRAPFDELLKLPHYELDKITRYSLIDPRKRLAYLEEDCDLAHFIRAAQISADDWQRVPRDHVDEIDRAPLAQFAPALIKPSNRLTIDAGRKKLARAFAFVAAAMSIDPNRQALNGVQLEIEKGKRLGLLIATDGRRLHAYSFELAHVAPCDLSALIPREAVENLIKPRATLNFKRVEKEKHSGQIAMTFERHEALSDWLAPIWIEIDGERYKTETAYTFPKWRQVIPKDRQLTAPLDISLLAAALDAHERACADFVADCLTLSAPRIQGAFDVGGAAHHDRTKKDIERQAKRELRASTLAENLAIEIINPERYQYLALPKLRQLIAKIENNTPRLTSTDSFDPDAHLNLRAEYVRDAVEACALLNQPPAVDVDLDPIKRTPKLSPIQFGNAAHLTSSTCSGYVLIMPMRLTA